MAYDLNGQLVIKNGLNDQNKGTLSSTSGVYPPILRQLFKKPPPLYYRGNVSLLRSKRVLAVVGSRNPSLDCEQNLKTILSPIRHPGLTIVSGLALGIDALAHEIALKNKLPTIAILGSSVQEDEISPRTNAVLARQIIQRNGLLLSPFAQGTPILPHNFPARNQFIAALSSAVLVAVAAKKSGSLITARFALDYGKDVLTIPGSINDALYEGCNRLLRDGATPIIESDDILRYFDIQSTKVTAQSFSATEQPLLHCISQESLTINEISQKLKRDISDVTHQISSLELNGVVEILANGKVVLC